MKLLINSLLMTFAIHTTSQAATSAQDACLRSLQGDEILSAKLPKNVVYVTRAIETLRPLRLYEFYQFKEYKGSFIAIAKDTAVSEYERSSDELEQMLAEGRLFFQVKYIPELGPNVLVNLFELNSDDGRLYWLNPQQGSALDINQIPVLHEVYVEGPNLDIKKFKRGQIRLDEDQLYAIDYKRWSKTYRSYGYFGDIGDIGGNGDDWVNGLPTYVNLGIYAFDNIEAPLGQPVVLPYLDTANTLAIRPLYRFAFRGAVKP